MHTNQIRTWHMSARAPLCAAAVLLAAVAPIPSVTASAVPAPHFALIDVGTFGGPHAELNGPAVQLTREGAVLGSADTTTIDEDYPGANPLADPDPYIEHGFVWHNGSLTDLGALPGNNSSFVFETNGNGVAAGRSDTGILDPLNGYPAGHAVVFKNGTVVDLGTLPGGTESQAIAINDRGQVAGFGNNGVPDALSMLPWNRQTRSFIWEDGVMHDLGTLGGPDTVVATLNPRGQIAGDSYTSATPNSATGVPTTHPFLWTDGHMRDLGTLGGTQTITTWLNDTGDVIGSSTLAGDQATHPFLWDGTRLRDLVGLGGDYGIAWHINDTGAVIGWASPASNETIHAFEWTRGVMTDLSGTDSGQCTYAEGVNSHDQVVGGSCDGTALLWYGGTQYDLNTLVAPSGAHLTEATYINDHGAIAALGVLPNGDQHVFLLRPAAGISALHGSAVRHRPNSGRPNPSDAWPPTHAVDRFASLRPRLRHSASRG